MVAKSLSLAALLFAAALAHDAPYSIQKFRSALDGAKLQAPVSAYDPRYSIRYGDFAYRANRYFYLQDGRYMNFLMCGAKNRSELRRRSEWPVTATEAKRIEARLLPIPLDAKREFTFLQIHDTGTAANKPLLRVVWRKKYRGKKDHLWAVIRLSDHREHSEYEKVDLGEAPKNGAMTDMVVEVHKGRLRLWRDGELKVDKDVTYWKSPRNYFKAGVYLQDDGCARVLFDKLNFID